ncbi:MBOAT family O-acyltransferase [Butyrivibrio sp. MC2021]|uniref:MBOAT family O-acyltransferase n=1 Tax=Butyrivibrio sp. MC2021 TaxID=1408306 RepID=UPI00047DF048|nr:MBOAT family O-acyltransferase [Butyrivibrio sp. MC2021]
MTITAFSFAYAIAVALLFYILRGSARKVLLMLAGICYIFGLNRAAGVSVIVVSVLAWAAGLLVEKTAEQGKKRLSLGITYGAIFLAAASLFILKYIPAYFGRFAEDSELFKKLFMPAGYSFYIFQVISYIADIKRENVPAEKNPLDIILYLTYFPKFVSGPIERWENFSKELKKACDARFFDPERWKKALYFMLFGCFMKVVIADRLGIYVDKLFEGYAQCSGVVLLLGAIAYTFQIYCDFAGYSYVAMGLSKMFDIELMVNFDLPYCSSNITEFWRRWHISLSSWFLGYIYIPLGGNRKGNFRKVLNTMIVFLVCGMWHGAGFNFIFWGLLHGIYSAFDLEARKRKWTAIRSGVSGRLITFIEAAFAWIFFRATSFTGALRYIASIVTNGFWFKTFTEEMENLQLKTVEIWVMAILVVIISVLDRFAYNRQTNMPEILAKLPQGRRYICFYLLAVAIIIFGIYGPALESRLIYMGF